jgi:hypothetical protein
LRPSPVSGAPTSEEEQFLKVGQDVPGSAVLEGVVDTLLLSGRPVCGHAGQDHLARSDDIRQALFAFHLAIFPGCSLAKRPGLENG